jgi:uncharacterized protein (TIGR03437 family)
MRKIAFLLALVALPCLFGQNVRVQLNGHMHPAATATNDGGRVDSSLTLRHVTLILKPTAAQQSDLTDFLARQQDPASPDYHQWLTPQQYGARFGLAQADIDQVTAWLAGQKLTVDSVGPAHNTITFTGAVRDIEQAFQTEIHRYTLNGEIHFANATEPSVPATLNRSIQVVHGLDDFRLRPSALRQASEKPRYTSSVTGNHYLAPDDVGTIFDIAPLYNSGITGKGQKIVVVGQTQVDLSDIREFRSFLNLSANDPQLLLVPNSKDPGVSNDDLPEADLDIEWSGAIARDASIIYVYSNDVTDAAAYAINSALAPVISMSYGLCEGLTSQSGLTTMRTYAQQANAQGITWIAASGDNGANDCYGISSRGPTGLSVDAPASIPEVTGIGGTTLTEGSGTYWNTTNNNSHASAISYIPESVWNDTAIDGSPSSSGGGASITFAKPTWQIGPGVPADGARDVPDISLPASADHDAYLVYTSGSLEAFGGTSVGAPVFAGMAGLLNQYLVANGLQSGAGLGNMNPRLYALAQSSPGVFHDITTGNNIVNSCATSARTCVPVPVGFNAGTAYDQATGLGTVDAFNLITSWHQASTVTKAGATVKLTSSLFARGSTTLTATVTGSGNTVPTGSVTFYLGGSSLGASNLTASGTAATAALTVTAAALGEGTPTVSAIYSGDSVYASASDSVGLTISSSSALAIQGLSNAASYTQGYAPGMIVAMFGQNLAASTVQLPATSLPTQLGDVSVTLNGIAAPLYYVSSGQVNLQIPYEIPANSTAIVKITSGGRSATAQITVTATAPGIFGDADRLLVPYQDTGRGKTIALYVTGDGIATPQPVTGSVPDSAKATPVPGANVAVSVGGVAAAKPFGFIGIPSWSIGVTQINFTIPPTAPLGLQPVVVSAGGVTSAPVFITVTP